MLGTGSYLHGRIEELISELKSEYTVVIVTHNMQQAARCSDHTAFMYLGELIEFSDTDTLFTTGQETNRRLHHWSLWLMRRQSWKI